MSVELETTRSEKSSHPTHPHTTPTDVKSFASADELALFARKKRFRLTAKVLPPKDG